jgi:hypothetical protein
MPIFVDFAIFLLFLLNWPCQLSWHSFVLLQLVYDIRYNSIQELPGAPYTMHFPNNHFVRARASRRRPPIAILDVIVQIRVSVLPLLSKYRQAG